MKIIYLWGNKNTPTPETWGEFNVIRAFYCEDEFIPRYNEVVAHPYYTVGMKKKLFYTLTEASFFTLSYIDKKEGDTYTLKSLVKSKKPEVRDYQLEIYTDPTEFQNKLNSYAGFVVEFDSTIIKNEHKTTDQTVETIYYTRDVIDVIESY